MAPKVNIEALSDTLNNQDLQNRGNANATTPAEQRVINPEAPLTDGPRRGEKDEYLPASYMTSRKILRTDR